MKVTSTQNSEVQIWPQNWDSFPNFWLGNKTSQVFSDLVNLTLYILGFSLIWWILPSNLMSGPSAPPPPPPLPTFYNGSTHRIQINLMCYYFIVYLSCQSIGKSYFLRNTQVTICCEMHRLRSNWHTLLAQHDVIVDHTMLSGVVKLANLQCSTICDNVCWTMLRGYVKLTYICWTTSQIYIAIICSQFFIRKDSSVGSTLAS